MRPCTVGLPSLLASLLLLGCREEAESPTAPEPQPVVTAAATTALAFSGISGGFDHSCGLTADGRAYCWGRNSQGQLGVGPITEGLSPLPVAGGLRFRQLSAGYNTTCGVTTGFLAYCWGRNDRGELGDGTKIQRFTPVAVVGGRKFSQVETNFGHTCGVSYPNGRAYCWGWNADGQLGEGTNTGPETDDLGAFSPKPLAVLGGLTFRRVTTGFHHSCGVTTDNRAYCWGLNQGGQLGDGTEVYRRKTPRIVAGGLAFAWVDAGAAYTCAVTTGNRAFCWGQGTSGQRGDGSVTLRVRTPRAVLGGHLFTRVTAAVGHTCGVTPSNQAWCWGFNAEGEVGDGTNIERLTPHAVASGLAFTQLSAGGAHTCGRTTAAVGYCWGENIRGQLGNGTKDVSSTPVPVSGPN